MYADFITAGTLLASLIKSGTIESSNGQLQINLDAGTFTSGGTAAQMVFNRGVLSITNGGSIVLYNGSGQAYVLRIGNNGYFALPECSYMGYHVKWSSINGVPVLSHT